ncbi:MAG TPA: BON domain-containing protein [Terriglobales bacterium]|nr:BON domain-containing protein [Terriglobales bacterium]
MRGRLMKALLAAMFVMSSIGLLCAQQESSQVPANNTKVNQRDRNQSEPTADQQKENTSDRQLTQQIRRAIVKDKNLSSDAHNVKIITQNGAVTLKGPVKSEEEKQAIESKAAEVAGAGKVNSELQVAPGK